jgi:hypothetical protein
MPVTFTDAQLKTAKGQLEAGTGLRAIIEGMGLEMKSRSDLMKALRNKYTPETIRDIRRTGRRAPTFDRLPDMIKRIESDLTVEKIDAMLTNLAAATAELDRIKSEIQ